jgi:thiol-disulfide isomerase/thioredoxin
MKKICVIGLLFALPAACSRPGPKARPELVGRGEPAPQLVLPGLINAPAGRLADIGELKGKVVVLEFWATWCEPCVDNIPAFNALAEKFRGKPVVFISVTDESPGAVAEFLKKTPIKGWIAPGAPAEVFRAYRVFGRPHTVVIGRDSMVAAITLPREVTEARLDLLLAGQAAGFAGAGTETARARAPSSGTIAEFYLGEPEGGGETAEFSREYYAGHNLPLTRALEYFYRETRKIEAAGAVSAVLEKRYELRVRLRSASGAEKGPSADDGLREFFADNIKRSLGLRLKTVNKNTPVYLLRPARGGVKGFKRSGRSEGSSNIEDGGINAWKMPVGPLCGILREKLALPLLDETGLKGEYDYAFRPGGRDLAGINTSLIDQLGLRLLPATRRIPVLEVSR